MLGVLILAKPDWGAGESATGVLVAAAPPQGEHADPDVHVGGGKHHKPHAAQHQRTGRSLLVAVGTWAVCTPNSAQARENTPSDHAMGSGWF